MSFFSQIDQIGLKTSTLVANVGYKFDISNRKYMKKSFVVRPKLFLYCVRMLLNHIIRVFCCTAFCCAHTEIYIHNNINNRRPYSSICCPFARLPVCTCTIHVPRMGKYLGIFGKQLRFYTLQMIFQICRAHWTATHTNNKHTHTNMHVCSM